MLINRKQTASQPYGQAHPPKEQNLWGTKKPRCRSGEPLFGVLSAPVGNYTPVLRPLQRSSSPCLPLPLGWFGSGGAGDVPLFAVRAWVGVTAFGASVFVGL